MQHRFYGTIRYIRIYCCITLTRRRIWGGTRQNLLHATHTIRQYSICMFYIYASIATHCNTLQHAATRTHYTAIFDMHVPSPWYMASRFSGWCSGQHVRIISIQHSLHSNIQYEYSHTLCSHTLLSPYNTAYTAIFNMNILTPYVLTPYYLHTTQPTQQYSTWIFSNPMFSHNGIWRVAIVADAVCSMSEFPPHSTDSTALINMYVLIHWYIWRQHIDGYEGVTCQNFPNATLIIRHYSTCIFSHA